MGGRETDVILLRVNGEFGCLDLCIDRGGDLFNFFFGTLSGVPTTPLDVRWPDW